MNSRGEEAEGSYYVGPPLMADQEIKDEENYNFHGVIDDDEYDLEEFFDDEPEAIAVDTKSIDASQGAEKEGWMAATRDELGQIVEKRGEDRLHPLIVRRKVWRKRSEGEKDV